MDTCEVYYIWKPPSTVRPEKEGETMASRATANCRDLRVQRTYKMLKGAFEQMLYQKPFDQITVQEICEAAMVRRTTFYQHFEDKQDFLQWFIREKQQEIARAGREMGGPADMRDHYIYLARRMLKYLNENDQLLRLLMAAGIQARQLVDTFAAACVEDVVQRIEASPTSREKLRGMPSVLAAEYYVGGMIAAAKWWFTHNKPCSEEELIQQMCRLVEEKKIL